MHSNSLCLKHFFSFIFRTPFLGQFRTRWNKMEYILLKKWRKKNNLKKKKKNHLSNSFSVFSGNNCKRAINQTQPLHMGNSVNNRMLFYICSELQINSLKWEIRRAVAISSPWHSLTLIFQILNTQNLGKAKASFNRSRIMHRIVVKQFIYSFLLQSHPEFPSFFKMFIQKSSFQISIIYKLFHKN